MCISHKGQKNYEARPVTLSVPGRKISIKKKVSFRANPAIHFYEDVYQDPYTMDVLNKCSTNRQDPLSKDRRIKQMIVRRAVLSYQHHLRGSNELLSNNDDHIRLASMSAKFSRRAKDIALETARMNFLEAYGSSDRKGQKFSPESESFKLDVPVQISEFPMIKLIKRTHPTQK